jgi:two-component system OmpR family sensor kinase
MRRHSLAYRTALVTTSVAVVAVLIAGVLTYSLTPAAAERAARGMLAQVADNARTEAGGRRIGNRPVALRVANISLATFDPAGRAEPGAQQPARSALSAAEVRSVVAGQAVSTSRRTAQGTLLVEARPTTDGGAVVVTQRRTDARGAGTALVRRTLWALLIGLLVAIPAGIWLARRLARPLKHAASAARAMAAGHREIRLEPEGPAEVADVAESINTLAGALAHSEGRQREFLLSVSHELRTPLTAISGFAEALADGVTPDPATAGQTILAESRRLERLVTDLLDLARLGAADFRIDVTEVDLTGLVREAAAVWRARCEAEGVLFGAELPDQPVIARTDPTRVRQIIDGLAENALRVTPAARPVVFALYPGCVIQVRDGGPGLTAADRAVAFERSALYQRYRGVRQVGTGLGLALVHGLATRLGGTAEVGQAPEGGACFTVRIPPMSDLHQPTVPIRLHPAAGPPHAAG